MNRAARRNVQLNKNGLLSCGQLYLAVCTRFYKYGMVLAESLTKRSHG